MAYFFSRRLWWFWLVALLVASCIHHHQPTPPSPPPPPQTFNVACVVTDVDTHSPIRGATCHDGSFSAQTDTDGYFLFLGVPAGPRQMFASAPDYPEVGVAYQNDHHQNVAIALKLHRPFPPPPTRDQVLAVHLQLQGMTVHTAQFGDLPWFEAAMAWLNPVDRRAAYVTKHAAGDTHSIVGIPTGKPLYNECCQPYTPDRFGPLDWTNGLQGPMDAQFVNLVSEQIQQGFIPLVFFDEDKVTSNALIPLVLNALQNSPQGDLTRYVMLLPGWDGVFYGWEPSQQVIPAWATAIRSRCPSCYLGIEFNTGHIPLGGGAGDYAPGGLMKDFDALFIEFDDRNLHSNNTWGIVARLIGPQAYHAPADDTPINNGHDRMPRPWYTSAPTSRGPWGIVCFEYGLYEWVRSIFSASTVADMRAYLYQLGCPVVN